LKDLVPFEKTALDSVKIHFERHDYIVGLEVSKAGPHKIVSVFTGDNNLSKITGTTFTIVFLEGNVAKYSTSVSHPKEQQVKSIIAEAILKKISID